MKNIFYTEEHELFRSSLQDFFAKEVMPNVDEWEKNQRIDHSIFKKMGEMGFLGLEVEEKHGGMGLDCMYSAILNEEMGKTGYMGFATTISAHSYLALNYLVHAGSDFVKEKYLLPSCKGEIVGSLGMTEPFAGSDLKGIKTTAVSDGDFYIVNGSKTFISNAFYGDYCVTAVRTEKGISMIVIDLDAEGVMRSKLNKLGLHSSDTAELAFDNVRVPKENLLGEENKGFYYMMQSLQVERLTLAQANIGIMQYVLDVTLQYISERSAFGQTINNFQVLRHTIAELASDLEAWKVFTEHTSYRLSQGEQVVKECSMLKLKTSDLANEIVYKCLQMFGGYGFVEDFPIARVYRDVRVLPIYAGTSEIMKEIIAKMVIEQKTYKSSY
ncbi:MAG: acyl-CoA dehydrogenase [Pseudopedobacter saltans]|uniref:Acyl-CoA dehydrogenase n=1 Tax=Pseudopedobacter saltans TaxID=151895 RepID=A0A2W5H3K4_9SPHI|nr:MAG: acyl-CoA dehydrogenase [Pseudopedobacter saltans]